MRWINTLERRFGHLAIPGLMRVVVAFNALVFLLLMTKPDFARVLELRPDRIMGGEVWRLFTYIFIPQVQIGDWFSIVWVFIYLNFLWLMGEGLEQAWGSFRLNLFYFLGMLGTTIAAFCFNAGDVTGVPLNLSLFFAFATLFPNYPILLLFIVPVRVKWIALFFLVSVLLQLGRDSLATRLAILVSLTNYLIFFGPEWVRTWREQGRVAVRQQQFQLARHVDADETLHHCKICGSTEATAPEMEFRVAADGEEYCVTHLPSRGDPAETPPTVS